MKKADEYIEELGRSVTTLDGNISKRVVSIEKARVAVKNVQIDAIDAAVKRCAEEAEADYEFITTFFGDEPQAFVEKDSILQVADKLKKELE